MPNKDGQGPRSTGQGQSKQSNNCTGCKKGRGQGNCNKRKYNV